MLCVLSERMRLFQSMQGSIVFLTILLGFQCFRTEVYSNLLPPSQYTEPYVMKWIRRFDRLQSKPSWLQEPYKILIELRQFQHQEDKHLESVWVTPFENIPRSIRQKFETWKAQYFDTRILVEALQPIMQQVWSSSHDETSSWSLCAANALFPKFRKVLKEGYQINERYHFASISSKYAKLLATWNARELPLCTRTFQSNNEEWTSTQLVRMNWESPEAIQKIVEQMKLRWHCQFMYFASFQGQRSGRSTVHSRSYQSKWQDNALALFGNMYFNTLKHMFVRHGEHFILLMQWYENPTTTLFLFESLLQSLRRLSSPKFQNEKEGERWEQIWQSFVNGYMERANEWYCTQWIQDRLSRGQNFCSLQDVQEYQRPFWVFVAKFVFMKETMLISARLCRERVVDVLTPAEIVMQPSVLPLSREAALFNDFDVPFASSLTHY